MAKTETVEEFLARGGKVTRVANNARAYDDDAKTRREFARAARDGGTVPTYATISERVAERAMETAHDAAHVGDRDFAAEVAGGALDHIFEREVRRAYRKA